MNVIITNNIGIASERIYWMRTPDNSKFWCRKAVSFFGSYNIDSEDTIVMSPFDPRFRENFIEGKGKTKEEALKNMSNQAANICDMLWAV